jgi:hypothetical protein
MAVFKLNNIMTNESAIYYNLNYRMVEQLEGDDSDSDSGSGSPLTDFEDDEEVKAALAESKDTVKVIIKENGVSRFPPGFPIRSQEEKFRLRKKVLREIIEANKLAASKKDKTDPD